MLTYGQTIQWSPRPGQTLTVRNSGHATPAEALADALTVAIELGWTPPRWWQWWRWYEVRVRIPTQEELVAGE